LLKAYAPVIGLCDIASPVFASRIEISLDIGDGTRFSNYTTVSSLCHWSWQYIMEN